MNICHQQSRIAISWHGLPPYAARLICSGIKTLNQPVCIIASKPKALIHEVEEIIEQPIIWLNMEQSYSWRDLGMVAPDIFFQSGWSSQAFRTLGDEVYQNGGKIICFSDNSFKNTRRQWLGAIFFRLHYRSRFHAIWVPGVSGSKICKIWGMPDHLIYKGMYGADPTIFFSRQCLSQRDKKIIFVGQLIQRKGIDLLIKAFKRFHNDYPDWVLHIVGDGELKSKLSIPGVVIQGFKTTQQTAVLLRESRFLILPSFEEHWGLVVHEAALSGCGLIVSDSVGAAPDLVSNTNGVVFKTNSAEALYQALCKVASFSSIELDQICETSQAIGTNFGPDQWAKTFKEIIISLK